MRSAFFVAVVALGLFAAGCSDRAPAPAGATGEASSLPANSGSDHQSFQQVGVPVLYLESGDFATIHTPADTVANIQVAELKRIGDVAFAAIKQLLPEIARAQGPA